MEEEQFKTVDTIVKVNNIASIATSLTEEDIYNIQAAKTRIKETARQRGGLDQQDKDALDKLDAAIRIYQVFKK